MTFTSNITSALLAMIMTLVLILDVHRIGRTARAGKEGRAFLLLSIDQEPYMKLKDMRSLPVVPADLSTTVLSPASLSQWHESIERAFVGMDNQLKEQAYQVSTTPFDILASIPSSSTFGLLYVRSPSSRPGSDIIRAS